MRPPTMPHRRALAAAVGGLLLLAACGGGSDGGSSAAEVAAEPGEESGQASGDESEPDVFTTAGVDLGGPEVAPTAEIETNLFPDLVVDDIGRGKKVNIRNIVPSEKPVLLWMWAPH